MKKHILRYILILANLVFGTSAHGQNINPLYKVSGKIVDSATRQSLSYVTINLKSDQGRQLRASLSQADGSFAFSDLQAAKYTLTVVAVGYQTKTITADLSDSSIHNMDLGIILMTGVSNKLKEVVIKGDRPVIRQEIDRITYDLQVDPDSRGSSVLEMMRKVPLLSVDANDHVLLKGSGDYKILINGRPSSMLERNATEVLKSLPASAIKSIEVITTPPAKYDSEGLAGIINIITNRKLVDGYNGTLNLTEKFPVGGPGFGTSLAAKSGKFGMSALAGGSFPNAPLTSNFNNRTGDGTDLVQNGLNKSNSKNGYANVELSYEIDSLQMLSAQLNVNASQTDAYIEQGSLLSDPSGIIESFHLANNNNTRGNGQDAALNYQITAKADRNRLLTFSYRYVNYNNDQDNNSTLSQRINYALPDYQQANKSRSLEQTVQADYIYPVNKLTIEAGLKGIFRSNQSDFQYYSFNNTNGRFELDPTQTNMFGYNQQVLAAYNSYQWNSKYWGVQAGVRLERTTVDANFSSSATQVKQNYFNIFPNIAIIRRFEGQSSLTLGFSQRLRRPGIAKLNPFIDRSNPDFVSSGNPNLRAVLFNNVQAGFSQSGKINFNFTTSYSFVNNLDFRVSSFDPVSHVTTTTYENTGRSTGWDNSASISYPLTKSLNLSINGNITYVRSQGLINNVLIKNSWWLYSFSASGSMKLPNAWRISGSLNDFGPNPVSLQGTSNASVSTALSFYKDLIKNKLVFSATVNNPLTKYRDNRIITKGSNFDQLYSSQNYFRTFGATLNYRFGKLKESIKKNKKGINNDDVSNN